MIGSTVGHYRILELIGRGGMGVVYRAVDTRLDRPVALKFLPPHLSSSEGERSRFIREARAASALDHPNICTIHEIGEAEDGRLFIAMACYDGESLKERIRRGPVPVEEAVEYAVQIARGLTEAHARGIVHRDVKPANLIVTDEGRIKIVDFGLAKLVGGSQLTKTGSTMGTAAYMSPEQAKGEDVDERTDVWSLGVVLYEMLTGALPFRGEFEAAMIYMIVNQEPDPPLKYNPSIPPELDRIVLRSLAKDPEKRYASAAFLLRELTQFRDRLRGGGAAAHVLARHLRRPAVAIPAAAIVIVALAASAWFLDRGAKVRWARQEALPEIQRLAEAGWRDFTDVFELASMASRYIPDDPELEEIVAKTTLQIDVASDPPGADVYVKVFDEPESEWEHLGTTPLTDLRLPIGVFRWKLEKAGYETVWAASSSWDVVLGKADLLGPFNFRRRLDPSGTLPAGMVRVERGMSRVGILPDFYVDRHEVSNEEFKTFVDAGGYRIRDYWKEPFVKDGRSRSWEEAMAEFIDRTGRPGPSTWVAGDYPEGKAGHPVSGVSWYEAAAYAEFVGKRLPTAHHWGLAQGEATPMIRWPQLGGFALYAPVSNMGGAGTVPAGSLPGISPYGAYDMAGNVREWCSNESPLGRIVRGGAWNDPVYMFRHLSQSAPFDRSERNGFRLALYPDEDRVPAAAFERISFPEPPDFYQERPVDDAVFDIYREQFDYDPLPLNAVVEHRDDTHDDWIREHITFDAAYGDERVILHLFLPRKVEPPYQAVIYVPGSGSLLQGSSDDIENYSEVPTFLSFLVKNGRAVLYPVYKGTFERSDPTLTPIHGGAKTHAYTDLIRQVTMDFRRSIDYLETRSDIDHTKIGYYGMSWGGGDLGAIIPAVEDRVKASVLVSGAIGAAGRPEVNPVHYLPRVQTPTLMLNGRYDTNRAYETHIKPMFDLLGTPGERKALMLYETDHIPPRTEFIKETLAWFDRYLGSVR